MKQIVLWSRKEECCGCEACANICTHQAISMQSDSEGFYYPALDKSKCVQCGLCETICPVKHNDEHQAEFSKAFAGYVRDESDLLRSASGGAAAALSQRFIAAGGIVYGVAYSDDFQSAQYVRVAEAEELDRLRTSKYCQARKNDVYLQIKQDIRNNKRVLFIGLPCDCMAVRRYVNSNPLVTIVSLVCHGPTSEKVQRRFCVDKEKKYQGKITRFSVRYKKNGIWKPYYIKVDFDNGKQHLENYITSAYHAAFIYFKRPSCLNCQMKDNHCSADLLIGDYHSVKENSEAYNRGGVSTLLPLTEHGYALIEELRENMNLFTVPLQGSLQRTKAPSSDIRRVDRNKFVILLDDKGVEAASRMPGVYFPMKKRLVKKQIKKNLSPIKQWISHKLLQK